MSTQRTHYVTTTDGVAIGATVHGQGPPLVFLHGAIGDGDLDWQALLPHLTDRFTCHLPSMRGRGLSGDHPDLGLGRLTEDYVAYIDSIGDPTGLVGWGAGANLALAVAANSTTVTGVGVHLPVANSLMDGQELAALGGAMARVGALAGEGELAAAGRAFARYPLTDEDIAAAEGVGYFEAAGRYVPNLLNHVQHIKEYEGPRHDDPAVLGAISAPVLILRGTNTKPFFDTSARHVADHVPDARVQEIPGAGHAAPLTHPEAVGEALAGFFTSTRTVA